jgi:DNA repair protein RadA/Sms
MAKIKNVWYCLECGQKQSRWTGQCPACGKWNTFSEEVEVSDKQQKFESKPVSTGRPLRLKEISVDKTPRIATGIGECDRLFGGGIVPGSLVLVGGDPGIGKSTLMLQMADALARQGLTVLYICGEESIEQTTLRARRLGVESDNLLLYSETNFSHIKAQVDHVNPQVLIVDSIQIVYKNDLQSAPGSVTQVRETTTEFMHLAKGRSIATFLIGHVTKAGEIAGPKVLEHLVDTVLYFEGDRQNHYRMIRVVKNRFGGTDEIALFQMTGIGLTEVPNASHLFLEERKRDVIGSVIIPTIEGSRPFLVEVQALVTNTVFSTPSRRCTGLDTNRLGLLLAVLEKRLGYPMYKNDVFVSIAGGLKITEPAVDLGVILAVASSLRNRMLDPETLVMGEVGLGGEIRSIPRAESRIKEAIHMGFKKVVLPKNNLRGISEELRKKIAIHAVEFVDDAIEQALR